jgi:hypothetical protein
MNTDNKIFSQQLIKELNKFVHSEQAKLLTDKARRIYIKCLKSGRHKTMHAIDEKYGPLFGNEDFTIAFSMAVMAAKSIQDTK